MKFRNSGFVWSLFMMAAGCNNGPTKEEIKVAQSMHEALTSTPTSRRVVKRQCNYGCYLAAGGVQCWGDNSFGELGNGTTTGTAACASNSTTTCPSVVAITTGATDLVLGDTYACAIVNGGVKCWGTWGGTTYASPVSISGITSGTTKVVVGDDHACAIANNAAYCWGVNNMGQLGASGGGLTSAVQVTNMSTVYGVVTDIAVGSKSGCGVQANALKCWGQIRTEPSLDPAGTPFVLQSNTPTVMLKFGVTAVKATDDYTCATVLGKTKCWGSTVAAAQGTADTLACGTIGPSPSVTNEYVQLLLQ